MTNWSDIGKTLRVARESRGFSIHDVAHYTRIPVKVLHELEEGDYACFPSMAYAKGFLSQYAEHLEVDASDWLDGFEKESTPLDLKNYEFLNDQEEELTPLPSQPSRVHAHAAQEQGARIPSSVLQPLAIFVATSMLLSAGVYGFIKLNERLSQVADEAPAPDAPSGPLVIEGPRVEGPSRAGGGKSSSVAPSLAAHTSIPQEVRPPVTLAEERALPLGNDTKPPRAVIVEE